MGIREQADYAIELANRFEAGSENARKAFIKYVRSDSVADDKYLKDPCFKPTTGKVYMNFAKDAQNACGIGSTFFHEHGHLIDYYSCSGKNYTSAQSSAFSEALSEDFKKLVHDARDFGRYSEKEAYRRIRDTLLLRPHDTHAVSDICSGLSLGQCKGAVDHRLSYWLKQGAVETEAFAHMFQAQFFPEQLTSMNQYFPKALEEFERLLSEVAQ